MFYIVVTGSDGFVGALYLCKATSFQEACRIAGIDKDKASHVVITKDTYDALQKIDAGYVKKEF